MSNQHDVTKDILIKAIDAGYIPRKSISHAPDALEQNLKSITDAYKEIFKVVNDPID